MSAPLNSSLPASIGCSWSIRTGARWIDMDWAHREFSLILTKDRTQT